MEYIDILKKSKLIAILRGVTPTSVIEVSEILVKSGFRLIEVPLNSPDAFKSIELLQKYYKNAPDILIGAGTVCSIKDVEQLSKINASLVISPNTNKNIIKRTKELNMTSIPGFLTPSEAYDAIDEGADSIKLFPFETFGFEYYRSLKTILPKYIPIIVVGGVDESNIQDYIQEGIEYFGLGSSLYKPNMDLSLLKAKANFFVNAIKDN